MGLSIDVIMDYINKPYKLKIIQIVQERKKCTAAEIQKLVVDISQATMYRTLDSMVENGILEVCEEIKVRAVTKKVYTVSSEWVSFQNSMISENNTEAYFGAFYTFCLKLTNEFRDYTKQSNVNIAGDGSGFSAVTIYASQEELLDIGQKINEIVKEYTTRKDCKQKIHTFATILTPPKERG